MPCYHRPIMLSPKKYFSSKLFGLNTSTSRLALSNRDTYSLMSVVLEEVGPSTMIPVWGAYRIIATL